MVHPTATCVCYLRAATCVLPPVMRAEIPGWQCPPSGILEVLVTILVTLSVFTCSAVEDTEAGVGQGGKEGGEAVLLHLEIQKVSGG